MPAKDPTIPIRKKASSLPGVEEGLSCTQTSYKVGKSAFLYVGMQGGRYKVMFKLDKSRKEADQLAAEEPDSFQTGSTAWVTARFTAESPMPKPLWSKWLNESYAAAAVTDGKKSTAKKTTQAKTVKKKTVASTKGLKNKAVAKKKAPKKTALKKKTTVKKKTTKKK